MMGNRKLSLDEFHIVKELAEEVAYAGTKADGKEAERKLQFFASGLRSHLLGNASNVLSEVVGYALSASGRVENKSLYIDAMKNELSTLESMADTL